jgi:hypothetical protein
VAGGRLGLTNGVADVTLRADPALTELYAGRFQGSRAAFVQGPGLRAASLEVRISLVGWARREERG